MHTALKTAFLSIAAALLATAGAAVAQTDFPTKPVTILVPFAAGGQSDITTRLLADALSKLWGQPVVVENRPGGGTMLALAAVAQSPADGYMLASISGSHTVNPAVRTNMPYKFEDLTGVSMYAESATAIAARLDFPADDMAGLVAEAKGRAPDQLVSFATPGLASSGHMSGEAIQREGGFKLQHVPYSGTTQALPDIVGGRVDLLFTTWSDIKPQVEAGKLKAIALLGVNKLPDQPNLGTVAEVIPGFSARAFNGIAAPSATPPEVVEKISADMRTVVNSEDYKKKLSDLGTGAWGTTPKETQDFLEGERARWQAIAQETGLKLD